MHFDNAKQKDSIKKIFDGLDSYRYLCCIRPYIMRRRDEADEGKCFVSWCVCVISASEAV